MGKGIRTVSPSLPLTSPALRAVCDRRTWPWRQWWQGLCFLLVEQTAGCVHQQHRNSCWGAGTQWNGHFPSLHSTSWLQIFLVTLNVLWNKKPCPGWAIHTLWRDHTFWEPNLPEQCPALCAFSQYEAGSCHLYRGTSWAFWGLGAALGWGCVCSPLASPLRLCSLLAFTKFQKNCQRNVPGHAQNQIVQCSWWTPAVLFTKAGRVTSTYLI